MIILPSQKQHLLTLWVLAFMLFNSFAWGIDLKKFDSPTPERLKYLSFKPPVSLRYEPVPLEVDRLNLVPLDLTNTKPSAPKAEDSNQSDEPEFPVVTYSTDPEEIKDVMPDSLLQISPSNEIPLADPFEGLSGADVGTTDELLNVFEDLRTNSRGVRMNPIRFIPPYTVAPDNLKVGTKATYRRVPR